MWIASIAIRTLGTQIDAEYPDRPTASDGTVASKAHDAANPTSDHRPHPFKGPGTVRGIDVTVFDPQGAQITEALRQSKDQRIKYVIYRSQIFTSYPRGNRKAWEWGAYTGAPHRKHFHLSNNEAHDDDARPYQLGATPPPSIEDNMLPLDKTSATEDIRMLQNRLNIAYGTGLTLDGVYGTSTETAVRTHLGAFTGDPEAQAGRRVVARQWDEMLLAMIRRTGGGSGGLSEAQVRAIVNSAWVGA